MGTMSGLAAGFCSLHRRSIPCPVCSSGPGLLPSWNPADAQQSLVDSLSAQVAAALARAAAAEAEAARLRRPASLPAESGALFLDLRPSEFGRSTEPCFICEEPVLGADDNDGFVVPAPTRSAGEALVGLLARAGCHGALAESRTSGSELLEVRIAACPAHRPSLLLLYEWCARDQRISEARVSACLPDLRAHGRVAGKES